MAKGKKKRKAFDRSKRYTAQEKSSILKAARTARTDGKTWAEAFKDARKAGYTGTLAGIEIMLRKARGAPKAGRKPGRPPKAGKAAKSTKAVKGKDLGVVANRLKPMLAQAARELRRLADELQKVSR